MRVVARRVDRRRLALAFATEPLVVAALVVAASVTFGGFYTPGMALVADRADRAGLAQGIGFGVTNTAWAAGALVGPPSAARSPRRSATPCPTCSAARSARSRSLAATRGVARLRPA